MSEKCEVTLSREKESLQDVLWRHHWALEPAPKSTTNYPRAPVGITRKRSRMCCKMATAVGYIYFCDMVFFGAYIRYISMLLVCVLCLVGGRCFLIRRLHAIFRTQQHPIWPPVLSPYGQTCRFIILCNHSADSFCQTGAIFLSCL